MGVGGRGCGCGCVEASPTQAVYVVVTCTGAVYVRPERLGVGHASKTAVTKKFVMEGVDTENIDTGKRSLRKVGIRKVLLPKVFAWKHCRKCLVRLRRYEKSPRKSFIEVASNSIVAAGRFYAESVSSARHQKLLTQRAAMMCSFARCSRRVNAKNDTPESLDPGKGLLRKCCCDKSCCGKRRRGKCCRDLCPCGKCYHEECY